MTTFSKKTTAQAEEIIDLGFVPNGKGWTPNPEPHGRIWESGEHIIPHLVEAIEQAEEMICFSSFIFDDNEVIKALVSASERGVQVFILTAPVHLKEGAYEMEDPDFRKDKFKELINSQIRNKILLRCADNIHAKFMVIDPKRKKKGFISTANFTNKALKENPEIVVELVEEEVDELFRVFVWHFWEATTDEQQASDQFHKVKPLNRFTFPELNHLILTSTLANKHTIRDRVSKMISNAHETIYLSTYGFHIDHSLGQQLLQKAKEGVNIILFTRPREKVIKAQLEKLVEAGASLYLQTLVHAKYVVVDGKAGAVFSANFESDGMDQGFETGILLPKEDARKLQQIAERWQEEFRYVAQNQLAVEDATGEIFVLEANELKPFKFPDKKAETGQ